MDLVARYSLAAIDMVSAQTRSYARLNDVIHSPLYSHSLSALCLASFFHISFWLEGEYRDDRRHGYGAYYWANNDKYEGTNKNSRI